MVELGIVGAKNSGKTTLIEQLIPKLVENEVRIATAKHTSHSHRFDTPGKDSHRHREAGAALTVALSEAEVAVFARPDTLGWARMQELISQQFDICLVEGDRSSERTKVLVTQNLSDLAESLPSNIIATIGPERVDGVATHFDSNDVAGLGSFVIETVLCGFRETRS
jgi:molybdopterin-guanine dinucleotide biosynthesis protein B